MEGTTKYLINTASTDTEQGEFLLFRDAPDIDHLTSTFFVRNAVLYEQTNGSDQWIPLLACIELDGKLTWVEWAGRN